MCRGGPGLVPVGVVAVARDVARLAANIAGFGAVGAVARDVPRLVAIVARLPRRVAPALGAVPRDVPRLVAIVARRLVRALRALARYVTRPITSVATVSLFLAISGEVPCAVALEALLALAVEARVARRHSAALRALPREVPRPITLVANARTHCNLLKNFLST